MTKTLPSSVPSDKGISSASAVGPRSLTPEVGAQAKSSDIIQKTESVALKTLSIWQRIQYFMDKFTQFFYTLRHPIIAFKAIAPRIRGETESIPTAFGYGDIEKYKERVFSLPLCTAHTTFFGGKEAHRISLLINPVKGTIYFIDGKGNDPQKLPLWENEGVFLFRPTSNIDNRQPSQPLTNLHELIERFKEEHPLSENRQWDVGVIKASLQGLMDCAPFCDISEPKIKQLEEDNPGKTAQEIMDLFVQDWRDHRYAYQGEVNRAREAYHLPPTNDT